MKNYEENEQLEAHLRRTLDEVARTTPRVITPSSTGARSSSRRAVALAASLLVLSGLGGLVVVAQRSGETLLNDAVSSPAVSPSDPTNKDWSSGSLLTTPVPGDVTPRIAIEAATWRVALTSDIDIGATSTPSAGCPGCGADRVVFEADGPSLSGALFTTWTVDASYETDLYDQPVSIGDVEGAARTRSEATPTAQNRVTMAWPIGDDQTRFADAVGLTLDEVIQIAEGSIPPMDPPPGFHRVVSTSRSTRLEFLIDLSDGERAVSVAATNLGVAGLLDWGNPLAHLLLSENQPTTVEGVVLAVEIPDDSDAAEGQVGAYWVAGDWGYRARGSGFDSPAEFTEVLADLRLTDTLDNTEEDTMPNRIVPERFDEFDQSTGWVEGDGS